MSRMRFIFALLMLTWFSQGASASAKGAPPTASTDRWWDSAVFYEIWPRSFLDTDGDGIGDFRGIETQLPYLKSLGVNAIWLTPIFNSPSYHGYDFTDFFQVQPDFGTQRDLSRLLQAAHTQGFHVIADMVINHVSNRHPWFQKSEQLQSPYADYFAWKSQAEIESVGWSQPWAAPGQSTWRNVWHVSEARLARHRQLYPSMAERDRPVYYYGVFGGSQPDLNFENPLVLGDIHAASRYWLEQGFDGFRLDAARYIFEDVTPVGVIQADSPRTIKFWQDFGRFVKGVNPDAYLVAEIWQTDEKIAQYYGAGGGLDAAFDFSFGNELVLGLAGKFIDQDKGPIFSVLPKPASLGGSIAATIHARSSSSAPGSFFASFLSNHDQLRISKQLGDDPGLLRVAASVLLTMPGTPYIYYGEEIGMRQPTFPDPADFYDDIFKRPPMLWSNGPNAGFTSGPQVWVDDAKWVPWRPHHQPWWQDFLQSIRQADAATSVDIQAAEPSSLFNYYRKLIAIRQARPELRANDKGSLEFLPGNGVVAMYRRVDQSGHSSIVVINPTAESHEVALGQNGCLFDLLSDVSVSCDTVVVAPYQTMILAVGGAVRGQSLPSR